MLFTLQTPSDMIIGARDDSKSVVNWSRFGIDLQISWKTGSGVIVRIPAMSPTDFAHTSLVDDMPSEQVADIRRVRATAWAGLCTWGRTGASCRTHLLYESPQNQQKGRRFAPALLLDVTALAA